MTYGDILIFSLSSTEAHCEAAPFIAAGQGALLNNYRVTINQDQPIYTLLSNLDAQPPDAGQAAAPIREDAMNKMDLISPSGTDSTFQIPASKVPELKHERGLKDLISH